MAHRSARRLAVLLSCALLAGALLVAAGLGTTRAAPAHARTLTADAGAPLRAARLAQAAITFRGGPIVTSTGETIDVRVSDSLPLATSTPEGWAEFLAKLTHGPEITRLTTFIVTFSEVQEICGSRALGCYGETGWWPRERSPPTSRRRRSFGTSTAITSPSTA